MSRRLPRNGREPYTPTPGRPNVDVLPGEAAAPPDPPAVRAREALWNNDPQSLFGPKPVPPSDPQSLFNGAPTPALEGVDLTMPGANAEYIVGQPKPADPGACIRGSLQSRGASTEVPSVDALFKLIPRDQPWKWPRSTILSWCNPKQRKYVNLLERTFRVKTAAGVVVPYKMEPFQILFHALSPVAMGPEAPDRLVEKSRGIGLTAMAAMDFLMLAAMMPRVTIPVASRQIEGADEFINRCWDLMQDATVDMWQPRQDVRSSIHLSSNGSKIVPVPGGNPASVRSLRAPTAGIDEYAFHTRPGELWRAIRPVLSEGGPLTVMSTHDGTGTHFYQLTQRARDREIGMTFLSFPLHDASPRFNRREPVSAQVRQGIIQLVAPWISLRILDDTLREDPVGYAQEYLAEVMDETFALLPRSVIEQASLSEHVCWEIPLPPNAHPLVAQAGANLAVRPAAGQDSHSPASHVNPVHVGVDFASKGDLAAYAVWEEVEGGLFYQRALVTMTQTDTPTQNAFLRNLYVTLRFNTVSIDETGPGTGLYQYAARELSTVANGIDFSSRAIMTSLGGGEVEPLGPDLAPLPIAGAQRGHVRVPIKKVLALNFEGLMRSGRAQLLREHPHAALQHRHLTAIRRSDLDAPRRRGEGHADVFWANALALYGATQTGYGPIASPDGNPLPGANVLLGSTGSGFPTMTRRVGRDGRPVAAKTPLPMRDDPLDPKVRRRIEMMRRLQGSRERGWW